MSMSLPILLAANLNEIISVLVGLAFFVIWVINQINDAKKKQAAQEQKAQANVPPRPADPAAAAPPDPLRAQVDEFLRRAGKQPAQPAPQRKPPARDEVVVLLDESAAAPPRKSLAEQVRAQAEAALRRANESASPAPPAAPAPKRRPAPRPPQPPRKRPSLAERTTPGKHDFNQEVADLGASVKQADELFDRQLQQKFDHELGTLASRPSTTAPVEPPPQSPTPASQIAALLANPEGVRQAVILNEILHRPSDRW